MLAKGDPYAQVSKATLFVLDGIEVKGDRATKAEVEEIFQREGEETILKIAGGFEDLWVETLEGELFMGENFLFSDECLKEEFFVEKENVKRLRKHTATEPRMKRKRQDLDGASRQKRATISPTVRMDEEKLRGQESRLLGKNCLAARCWEQNILYRKVIALRSGDSTSGFHPEASENSGSAVPIGPWREPVDVASDATVLSEGLGVTTDKKFVCGKVLASDKGGPRRESFPATSIESLEGAINSTRPLATQVHVYMACNHVTTNFQIYYFGTADTMSMTPDGGWLCSLKSFRNKKTKGALGPPLRELRKLYATFAGVATKLSWFKGMYCVNLLGNQDGFHGLSKMRCRIIHESEILLVDLLGMGKQNVSAAERLQSMKAQDFLGDTLPDPFKGLQFVLRLMSRWNKSTTKAMLVPFEAALTLCLCARSWRADNRARRREETFSFSRNVSECFEINLIELSNFAASQMAVTGALLPTHSPAEDFIVAIDNAYDEAKKLLSSVGLTIGEEDHGRSSSSSEEGTRKEVGESKQPSCAPPEEQITVDLGSETEPAEADVYNPMQLNEDNSAEISNARLPIRSKSGTAQDVCGVKRSVEKLAVAELPIQRRQDTKAEVRQHWRFL
ncbi:hypothetical protein NDN08_000665 [Rhodosorus marinus]|uniref:Uncharacterized protein n=1 Tax=Rhodosorus marinus TaxID=101924 RepID=A0AAV8URE3_9RHOD|nr:hypothetical protein NDN08_000665 [Rhodosorus marinus]